MTKTNNNRAYMRENVFVRRDNDGTVVAQRARVRGIYALVSSARDNKRMGYVNRDSNNAVINFRRYETLKTRPEELRRTQFHGVASQARRIRRETKANSGRPV